MAHHPRHGRRRGASCRWHPHARRHGDHGHRGPADDPARPPDPGRRPGRRHGHHHRHHLRALRRAARGHELHRQVFRPHHDAVVPLPRRRGPAQPLQQPRGPEGAEPRPRPAVPHEPDQPQRPAGHGIRLPRHHRRRGPLLRHGPRGQGQHLRLLARRQGLPHPQLPRPGRVASRRRPGRPGAHRHREPLLPDASGNDAPLCHRALRRGRHHRVPGAYHRLLHARVRGRSPGPHAPHAHQLPLRDQRPDLHPARQLHHVDRHHLRRAAVQDLRAHGGRLRPGHHHHDAHDHDPAHELPRGRPQEARRRGRLRRRLRGHRAHVLRFLPHDVLRRRLRDGHPGGHPLRRDVRVAPRHGHRAHPDRLPARGQVPRPALRPLPRRRGPLPGRQPRLPHERLVHRQARPRHPLLHPGQAAQAREGVLLPERPGDGRALHARVHRQQLRHRLPLQGAAAPGLQGQPARQHVPVPDRDRPR